MSSAPFALLRTGKVPPGKTLAALARSCHEHCNDRSTPPAAKLKFDALWKTSPHTKLHEARETLFGRLAEQSSFASAFKELEQDLAKLGGLSQLPHVVALQPIVLKITKLDELAQVAKCEGMLLAKWYEPELAGSGYPAGADVPASAVTVPAFPRMSTAVEQPDVTGPEIVHQMRSTDVPGIVYAVWQWRADIEVRFGLRYFPYDTQLLNVIFWFNTFGHPASKDLGRFVLPYNCGALAAAANVVHPLQSLAAEWRLHEPKVSAWNQSKRYNPTAHGVNGRKQGLTIEIPLRRRPVYHTNMLRIMGLIASLGFCAFAIPPANLGERLSVLFSLLLSLITFKFSVSDKLPRVAYVTRFDIYMHATFALLGLLAMHYTAMKYWVDRHQRTLSNPAANPQPAIEPAAPPAAGAKKAAADEQPREAGAAGSVPWWWGSAADPAEFEQAYILPAFVSAWLAFNAFMIFRNRREVVRKTSVLGREIKPMRNSLPGYTLQRRWERMQAAKLHAVNAPPPLPPKAS
ncbi:hypothetical protein DIPPA_10311 [Diplonema papillatum]|nr:hypothetical protein DIPPA_10311 [Diplonema papillatum]